MCVWEGGCNEQTIRSLQADVNLVGGSRQRTALHYASAGGHSEVVQLLLTAGANEFARDSGGYTALNICRGNACKLLHRVRNWWALVLVYLVFFCQWLTKCYLTFILATTVAMSCCANWRH